MQPFYNTIDISGSELTTATEKAQSQTEKIYAFFLSHPKELYTPFHVLELVFSGTKTPVTSIRRSLTNLTKQGKIVKVDEKRLGIYGQYNHQWRLAGGQMVMF